MDSIVSSITKTNGVPTIIITNKSGQRSAANLPAIEPIFLPAASIISLRPHEYKKTTKNINMEIMKTNIIKMPNLEVQSKPYVNLPVAEIETWKISLENPPAKNLKIL
jgi:hypothetical protein